MSTRWPQLARTTVAGKDRFREAARSAVFLLLLIDLVVNEPGFSRHPVV